MENEKPVILWVGDGGVATGFARVSHSIINNLPENKYSLHHLAINYKGDPYPGSKAPMYPAFLGGDLYGIKRLKPMIDKLKPDLIFILNDPWIINQYLSAIPENIKVVTYFPVDAKPLRKEWCESIVERTTPVAYTKYGKEAVLDLCEDATIKVIPHGTDTDTFYPIDMLDARKHFQGVTKKDFIVLNANRNQPRKRFDLTIKGFAKFAKNKPESVKLYCHCGVEDMGFHIIAMCERYHIESRLLLSSLDLGPANGVDDERLNWIYNAADIGLNTCYVPDTNVLTEDGFKKITDVNIGDRIYTHAGNISEVTNKFEYEKEEPIIRIVPYGAYPIELTANHKLFADIRQYTKVRRYYKDEIRKDPRLRFVKAEDLFEGSVLTFPIIKTANYTLNSAEYEGADIAFIYGAYLAEGSTSGSGIRFSLNSGKSDDFLREEILRLMRKVFGLEGHIYNYTCNRQTIEYYSAALKRQFESMFNRGARNKAIPKEFHFLGRDEKIALLKAYWLGDGHLSNKAGRLSFSTTSESLAWSTWFMLTTLGSIAPSLERAKRGDWRVRVSGMSARHLAKLFDVELEQRVRQPRDKMWADNNYVYYPIRKIEHVFYNGKVYDLEVGGEHSYVTHVAGHNSMGEGWSLTVSEHAACRKAQLMPNHSALAELYSDICDLMPIDHWDTYPGILTEGAVVSPDSVAAGLEFLYTHPKERQAQADRFYNFVTQPKFQWKNIAKQWSDLFDSILDEEKK